MSYIKRCSKRGCPSWAVIGTGWWWFNSNHWRECPSCRAKTEIDQANELRESERLVAQCGYKCWDCGDRSKTVKENRRRFHLQRCRPCRLAKINPKLQARAERRYSRARSLAAVYADQAWERSRA